MKKQTTSGEAPRGAGRPRQEVKKVKYPVWLYPLDKERIEKKFGNLTKALESTIKK